MSWARVSGRKWSWFWKVFPGFVIQTWVTRTQSFCASPRDAWCAECVRRSLRVTEVTDLLGSLSNQNLKPRCLGQSDSQSVLFDTLFLQLPSWCLYSWQRSYLLRLVRCWLSAGSVSTLGCSEVFHFDQKMREIVHLQAGQCGNQIGAKVRVIVVLKLSLSVWSSSTRAAKLN